MKYNHPSSFTAQGHDSIPFTTNRNESMNNVAKAHVDYRKSTWVKLANNMYDLVTEQMKEVEKAVIGMGVWENINLSLPIAT